ncbi:MAG TPA: nucleotidyltransferase domain-containing protein [Planctomycetota bacterium]|nr:nucleotidyltransferase domain-containing protein [Planctomycetota bacterium]
MSDPAPSLLPFPLPADALGALDRCVVGLKRSLHDNLYSLALYGSAARGNFTPGVSDINVLIILEQSTPEAHQAIAEVLHEAPNIEPLVMGRRGLERSLQCFLPKFLSIRRNYHILAGADALQEVQVNQDVYRFLCEQSARNLRLRLKRAFIKRENDERWVRLLAGRTPALFSSLSDILRCAGMDVPSSFEARVPLISQTFSTDAAVLSELLRLKAASQPVKVSATELHGRVHALLNAAIEWMEATWPQLLPCQTGQKKI